MTSHQRVTYGDETRATERCGIARETGVLKMTAPRGSCWTKRAIQKWMKVSVEGAACGSGKLPDTLQAPFLPVLLTTIPNTAFFWLSLLSVSIPQAPRLHPSPRKRTVNCSLTPDGVVCLSKVGHPSLTQRYNKTIINGGL